MVRHHRPVLPGERPARLQALPVNRIIPNLITLSALCCGLTSLKFTLFGGEFEKAVVAIILAAILDGLDGRVARLLNGTSRFGAELDSLSDFVCFGVAPALLLYIWSLSAIGGLGWAITLLFIMCSALRLARFNTQLLGEEDLPRWAYNYFTGVPAPAAAGLAILPMILSFATDWKYVFSYPLIVAPVMVAVALLMISKVPTFSLKKMRIPRWAVLPLMVGMGVFIAFLVSGPWVTLSAVGLIYVALLPLSILSFGKRARQEKKLRQP